ncbi:hypothetical protein Tco_0535715 [Tanacetum coccineum]
MPEEIVWGLVEPFYWSSLTSTHRLLCGSGPELIEYHLESREVVKVIRKELSELVEVEENKKKALDDVASIKKIAKVTIEKVEETN